MSMAVKVGDKLRNNDPRKAGEVVVVINTVGPGPAIDKRWAVYLGGYRRSKVRFDRIVEVGEPHHNHLWTRLPAQVADL